MGTVTTLMPLWVVSRGKATPIVTDGLVAEYRFDDGSGQTLTDYVGGANMTLGTTGGSDTNDPTWVTAGLQFATDDSCNVAATPSVSQPNTRVLCVLFPIGGASTGYFMDGGTGGRQIHQQTAASTQFMIYAGTSVVAPNVFVYSQWKIITTVYNGASSTSYYSNDAITGLTNVNPGAGGHGGITLGSVNSQASLFTDMTAGYHLCYNKALSADEIAQNTIALTEIMAARGITIV